MISFGLGEPVVEAVKKLVVNFPEIERVSRSREDQAMQEQFSSLEETQSSPPFQFKDASQQIRYLLGRCACILYSVAIATWYCLL